MKNEGNFCDKSQMLFKNVIRLRLVCHADYKGSKLVKERNVSEIDDDYDDDKVMTCTTELTVNPIL